MSRVNDRAGKRNMSLSMVIGALLVPVSAFAAIALTGPGQGQAEAQTPPTSTTITTTTSGGEAQAVVSDLDTLASDLEVACGPAGMELVDLEASGEITEIQQAALDALRPICEQEGQPLPDKPAPEPITRTVEVTSSPSPGTTVPGTTTSTYDDEQSGYDDEYEDHDEREDEGEEHEDHEEDHHERGEDD